MKRCIGWRHPIEYLEFNRCRKEVVEDGYCLECYRKMKNYEQRRLSMEPGQPEPKMTTLPTRLD